MPSMPDPKGFMRRLGAIVTKEVRQLGRDRLTFAMMFGVPIMQLLLFGYAIDTDPHRLPTAVVAADQSQITRTILSALANTGYMRFTHQPRSEAEANELYRRAQSIYATHPELGAHYKKPFEELQRDLLRQ